MNEKLEKALSKSKLIVIFGIIAAACYLVADVPYFFIADYDLYKFDFLNQLVLSVAIIALLCAYKKGETNLQKALISGLLFAAFCGTFTGLVNCLDYFAYGVIRVYDIILLVIFSISEGTILISHLSLQSDHSGSMKAIKAILGAVIAGLIANIVDAVFSLGAGVSYGSLYLVNNLAEDCFLIMVLCIETKIQVYKKARAAAIANDTWTPEAKAQAKEMFKF